jgi:hypothetical protein
MTLDPWLRAMSRRLSAEEAARVAVWTFVGSVGVTVVSAVGLAMLGRPDAARLLFVAPPVIALGVYGVRRWLVGSPAAAAARALDARFGFEERVATALWLGDGGEGSSFVEGDALRVLAAVQPSARSLAGVDPSSLPRRRRAVRRAGIALAVLVVGFFLIPVVPAWRGPVEGAGLDAAARAEEAKRVQEVARRLARDADELERALHRRGLERAQTLARRTASEGRRLGLSPPALPEALARMTALRDEARRSAQLWVGRPEASAGGAPADPRAFGRESALAEALSHLGARLHALSPAGLEADLDAVTKELEASLSEAREPKLDTDALETLAAQVQELEKLLEEIQQSLPEGSPINEELASLTKEQLELLARIGEELERLCKGSSPTDGKGCTPEEFASAAEALRGMKPQDLDRLLRGLQELEALDVLEGLLAEATQCMGGGEPKLLGSRLQGCLARLSAGGSMRSPTAGPKLGDGPGRASGGIGERGDGDGPGETPERVAGRLDPRGRLGKPVPFRGLPGPASPQADFDRAIGRAADDAQEALGRDRLPPDARPFVRRYFESLKERK